MSRFLLDVNVLIAWGWTDHESHDLVAEWIKSKIEDPDSLLLTSAIPQLGFVRVSVQRCRGAVSIADACSVLGSMLEALGNRHEFLPDDHAVANGLPGWCQGAAKSTDAHLAALATTHDATLATLDTGIPGAFLLPATPKV